ncbi:hypothetical protein CIG75_05730 [Tumebacillus algifaecis]|uniref:SLH domain-containing protein n=1 Tax=Tumebacillus algifaecis TaxID=1214604 RepID=A0A223CZP4_9BACL|nr:S-layer homology domain-containing protein [Tumebacillus algifaecis]ASS74546.1 hypothetical protein CIG75_05730 [Tumebacillus algifaecis]
MSLPLKSLSVFTAACLLLAGTSPLQPQPVSAQTAEQAAELSEADAVLKARSLLKLSERDVQLELAELHEFDVFSDLPARKVWLLTFMQEEKSIYVALDAKTEELIVYHASAPEPAEEVSFHSPKAARQAAVQFLQATAPHEFEQTVEANGDYAWGYEYEFTFVRTVNGLPVHDQGLSVSVAWDGSVVSYLKSWEPSMQFPRADGVISEDKARQIFLDNLQMHLEYSSHYEGRPELMYRPYFTDRFAIDANSGDLVNEPLFFWPANVPPNIEPLVKSGPTAPPQLTTELSHEQALSIVDELDLLPASATYIPAEYAEYEDGEWFLKYESKDGEQEQSIVTHMIRLNASTAELVEYYQYASSAESGAESEEEEASDTEQPDLNLIESERLLELAVSYAKTLFPHRTGALALQTNRDSTMFEFLYLVNGLPASDTSLQLTLHPETGRVLEVMQYFSEAQSYSSAQPVLTATEAKLHYSKLPLLLYYGYEENEAGERIGKPSLRYRFAQNTPEYVYVNAQNGALVGLMSKNGARLAADIPGHWAEAALTRFAEQGLLPSDQLYVHPDAPIQRSTLIELLIGHLQPNAFTDQTEWYADVTTDHPNFFAINAAAHLGWIAKDKNFRPDDLITREELAVLISKAAGLDAKAHQQDVLPYADRNRIASWSYGAVALSDKQGWMRGYDNRFRPQDHLTLAEAVSVLYKLDHE